MLEKTKVMATGPITSWQVERGKLEARTDINFLGSKITAATKLKDTCSLEEKLCQTETAY